MNNQEYKKVIDRYFRGQLNESEYEILTDYLQNKSNREYFEQLKQEWNLNPEPDETVRKNWLRLLYKLNRQDSVVLDIPLTRRLWFKVASVAAILVLGLLCGGVLTYFFSANKMNSGQVVFKTSRGEKSLVILPDSSKVWLNATSSLTYHPFTSNNRQVELKGEAFFKIAHNEKAPFIVKTNECKVEVLGTTFDVMAYEGFGREEITLLEGRVNVHTESDQHVLKPGQALILKDNQANIIEANTLQVSGWIDNKLNFQNIPLTELIKRLENWYDVDITLDNKTGKEVNFTGTFKNEETIWQVLDAIKVYTPIQFEKTKLRKIKITVR
jgi:transmembrane sensor